MAGDKREGSQVTGHRSQFRFRSLPPSGVPITFPDILAGLRGACEGAASVERFRDAISRYFGVRHCFFASSGRAALSMLLTALRSLHPERDQVALPAYTSFSVPSAVVHAGLKVSLYDLDPETLSPDRRSLEQAISDRTLCIVVCHLYGYPCDMDAVRDIAARRGIPVVDDAAQAMGATFQGRYAGTLGDAGLFSLSRGKNISTVDGGIIVTDSAALAEALSRSALKPPGIAGSLGVLVKAAILSLLLRPRLYWIPAALPFLNLGASVFDPAFPLRQYTPFQAAVGRRMLARLGKINAGRADRAKALKRGLAEAETRGRVRLVKAVDGAEPVYLRLPVLGNDSQLLPEPALGVVRSYPTPLNRIEALRPHLVNDGQFPVAEFLAENMVTLPTHEFVTAEDIEQISNIFGATN